MEETPEEREERLSREEALAEYPQHKVKQKLEEERDECPHDEHDHGICLDCGKDIWDDLVARADFLRDE